MGREYYQPITLTSQSNAPLVNESISVILSDGPKTRTETDTEQEYQLRVINKAAEKPSAKGNTEACSLLLLGPNLAHAWTRSSGADGETSELSINFSEVLVQRMVQVMPELQPLTPLLLRARQGLQFGGQTLDNAQQLLQTLIVASGAERVLLFFQLLGRLAQSREWQALALTDSTTRDGEKGRARIHAVLDFLSQHYDQDLSLKTVAASHDMSASYLSRLFKQETGTGFSDFLINLRITRACELLSHSEQPITEICFDTGFKNISNFNRRFVALKKTTPSEYRRAD